MPESVSFDRAAGYYDRTRAVPDSLMSRLVPMLVAEIPRDGCCLEIGIGTGRIALPLIRAGVDMVGVDISRLMLARLVENAGENPPPVTVADATRLPFRDRSFASAIAAHVLHLIPDWVGAISEVLRVLKPGGVLIASRGRSSSSDWAAQVHRRFFLEAGNPPWPPGVDTLDELDEHMRGRGSLKQELPKLAIERSASVNEMMANLEAGYLSACWSLDEPTRMHAAALTRAWARQELGDLDEPRPTVYSSEWHVYRSGK